MLLQIILQFLGLVKKKEAIIEKEVKPMISLKDYLTASGKYPDRETHKELTQEHKDNALVLIPKVEALLREIGVEEVEISSGFRPSDINSNIKNAAKKSAHMSCLAIDIVDDKDQSLCNKILNNHELLKKYGLWMENPSYTKGKFTNWTHLDLIKRSDRKIQTFIP